MIVGADLEWQHGVIDTLGLAFDEGTRAIATPRTAKTMWEFLQVLRKADAVVGQNFISADLRKLHEEGIDISWLEPKVVDTRLMIHACAAHLAGTGSYDLRNISLLYGERHGKRFLADWKCLTSDSRVRLPSGKSETIGNIVNNKATDVVMGWDGKKVVPTKIVDYFRNSRDGRKLYKLSHVHQPTAGGRKRGPVMTAEHQVLTNRGWVPIAEMVAGDLINTGTPGLSDRQLSAMLGCLLGDGHLAKTSHILHLFNKAAHEEYLQYKAQLFSNLGKGCIVRTKRIQDSYDDALQWHSPACPVLRDEASIVNAEFTILSLALWYMDDGSRNSVYSGCISCQRFSAESKERYANHISRLLGCGREDIVCNNNAIIFRKPAFLVLCKRIAPYVPQCMRYKLGDDAGHIEGLPPFNSYLYKADNESFWDTAVVKEYKPNAHNNNSLPGTVFCLQTELGNFLTVSGIISNCYLTDIERTCAYDAAATLWAYQNLAAQVKRENLHPTVEISHRCEKIFTRMREQGVRLDKDILTKLHNLRKIKVDETIERFGLWEERGKKVIKKVPIWRSNKLLDVCEERYGFRPANRQRATFVKLSNDESITGEAKEFVQAIVALGQGGNDAVWAGKVTESEDGDLSFGKLDENGFIYPRYDIAGSPDRAIASGPNVQNPPRVSDDPREIPLRKAFIPLQPDHVILCGDFGSLETYTNAIESDDWDRVKAIQEKRLSHEGTRTLINNAFNLSLDYTQGKACNHAFDKGESPYNLARRLFKTERPSRAQSAQCKQIFETMLADYPNTAKFRDLLWERSVENPLVVRNKFGRKLSCFSRAKYGDAAEYFAKHDAKKKYWCSCNACAPRRDRWKYAIAFLGRSSGFDALLRAMARIWEERRLGEFSLPILEVHDELDFSVPRKYAKEMARTLEETFREPVEELGGISLPVDAVWGDTWADCK